MAYVKIPETLLYNNAALRNSAAMRAWLYLYTSSTSATTWANKAYPVGQRVSSRSFVADALEVGDGVVKNVYKALSKWGLVDFVVEPTIKTNVATVAAVTMQHGYIYAELPDNYQYCFVDTEHHWQVYLYLMLHAAKEQCKLLGNRILERGQALLTQGSIAKALRISLTEIKQIFDDLRDLDLITTERVGNDGLMTTITKYQSKIDGTATAADAEVQAAKEKYGKSADNTVSTVAKEVKQTVTKIVNKIVKPTPVTDEEDKKLMDDPVYKAIKYYAGMRHWGGQESQKFIEATVDLLNERLTKSLPGLDKSKVSGYIKQYYKQYTNTQTYKGTHFMDMDHNAYYTIIKGYYDEEQQQQRQSVASATPTSVLNEQADKRKIRMIKHLLSVYDTASWINDIDIKDYGNHVDIIMPSDDAVRFVQEHRDIPNIISIYYHNIKIITE